MAGNVNLYFLAYNNYYNRIVKKLSTISDYMTADSSYIKHADVINYNPGDYCDTHYIFAGPNDYNLAKDYCVVTDANNTIIARWFIVEAKLTKAKQWDLLLHRDVVADFMTKIQEASVYMEKCPIKLDSPFIFNDENISLNQIKEAQYDIKDDTKIPWIVGYMAKDKYLDRYVIPSTSTTQPDYTVYGIDTWEYYDALMGGNKITTGYGYQVISNVVGYWKYNFDATTGTATQLVTDTPDQYVISFNASAAQRAEMSFPALDALAPIYFTDFGEDLSFLDGKTVYDERNNTLYTLSMSTSTGFWGNPVHVTSGALYSEMYTQLSNVTGVSFSSGVNSTSGSWLWVFPVQNAQIFSFTPSYPTDSIRFTLPSNRAHTKEAQYDIFFMPYGDVKYWEVGSSSGDIYYGYDFGDLSQTVLTKQTTIEILSRLAEQPDTVIYDLQLLPYCPISHTITSNRLVFTDANTSSKIVIKSLAVDVEAGIQYSKGFIGFASSKDLHTTTAFPDPTIPLAFTSPLSQKVAHLVNKYRLVSPTGQGAFDFSPYKNITTQPLLNIDCTFKPFTPFIQITPAFNTSGLYGGVYKDPRGLICGGNFSLTRTSDAWLNYQLTNKNYQNIFNRQIQSLDFTNERAERMDWVSAISGTISGGASGAASGSMIGGVPGAIIGGAVGTIAGGLTGAMDVAVNKELRNEARNLAIDQFGYQLGNIKALPNTLTKVDAFDIKCPIFPQLERYSCSDEEAAAVRAKIKYNGMTAGFISTIFEQLKYKDASGNNNYIKCKLIYLATTEAEDYHVYNVIADELFIGHYWFSGNF